MSPLITPLNQTEESLLIVTFPTTSAVGAIKTLGLTCGSSDCSLNSGMIRVAIVYTKQNLSKEFPFSGLIPVNSYGEGLIDVIGRETFSG